jgi:hypothetical protein
LAIPQATLSAALRKPSLADPPVVLAVGAEAVGAAVPVIKAAAPVVQAADKAAVRAAAVAPAAAVLAVPVAAEAAPVEVVAPVEAVVAAAREAAPAAILKILRRPQAAISLSSIPFKRHNTHTRSQSKIM